MRPGHSRTLRGRIARKVRPGRTFSFQHQLAGFKRLHYLWHVILRCTPVFDGLIRVGTTRPPIGEIRLSKRIQQLQPALVGHLQIHARPTGITQHIEVETFDLSGYAKKWQGEHNDRFADVIGLESFTDDPKEAALFVFRPLDNRWRFRLRVGLQYREALRQVEMVDERGHGLSSYLRQEAARMALSVLVLCHTRNCGLRKTLTEPNCDREGAATQVMTGMEGSRFLTGAVWITRRDTRDAITSRSHRSR